MQSQVLSMLLEPAERIRRIIWAAYVAAVPVYVAVVYVMSHSRAPLPVSPVVRAMILPLAILSVVSAILSRWLPGLLLSEGRIRELLEEEPDPETLARNPQTGVVDSDRLNRIRMLSAQEQRLLPVVSASVCALHRATGVL